MMSILSVCRSKSQVAFELLYTGLVGFFCSILFATYYSVHSRWFVFAMNNAVWLLLLSMTMTPGVALGKFRTLGVCVFYKYKYFLKFLWFL